MLLHEARDDPSVLSKELICTCFVGQFFVNKIQHPLYSAPSAVRKPVIWERQLPTARASADH